MVGIVKIVKQEEQNRKNIIILTLRELGVNVVELLAREQLYRQWKLPREVSDIIESNLVENVRFVNVLKRNIFTEKKLSEELREEIEKLISYYKIYNLIKRKYGELPTLTENIIKIPPINFDWKIFEGLELPTIPEDLRIRKNRIGNEAKVEFFEYPGNWFKEKKTKKPLIDKITLEIEAKERKKNIKRLEKEQLKPEKAELNRLSQLLTIKEKSVNDKLKQGEEKTKEAEQELENLKIAVNREKTEAIRNLEKEKQEKINELNTEHQKILNELETAKNQKEQELNTKIAELEQEKGILEGKKTTASESIRELENQVKELNKEIQQQKTESEILRKEINKELPWRKEGGTLREATHNFIKEKCRNERYKPTMGDKCVSVVTAPFKWVANKTSAGFALVGFGVSIPAICGALGWALKAFLAVKTGGVGGAVMVADSLISQSQKKKLGENNNQGGNLPPNYQPLPQGNNNVNNQLLPAAENTANLPPVINNHYHNLPAGKQANNHRKRKKKRTDNF